MDLGLRAVQTAPSAWRGGRREKKGEEGRRGGEGKRSGDGDVFHHDGPY